MVIPVDHMRVNKVPFLNIFGSNRDIKPTTKVNKTIHVPQLTALIKDLEGYTSFNILIPLYTMNHSINCGSIGIPKKLKLKDVKNIPQKINLYPLNKL